MKPRDVFLKEGPGSQPFEKLTSREAVPWASQSFRKGRKVGESHALSCQPPSGGEDVRKSPFLWIKLISTHSWPQISRPSSCKPLCPSSGELSSDWVPGLSPLLQQLWIKSSCLFNSIQCNIFALLPVLIHDLLQQNCDLSIIVSPFYR